MPAFAYRILPPRADFAATLAEEEGVVMAAHFRYLQRLEAEGRVIFVGRCETGDWGLAVFDAADADAARATAEADPAVASGLMRMELHAFRVVMQRRAEAVGSPAGAG